MANQDYATSDSLDQFHVGVGMKVKRLDYVDKMTVIDYVSKGRGVLPLACRPPKFLGSIKFIRVEDVAISSAGVMVYHRMAHSPSTGQFVAYARSRMAEGGIGDGL